MLRVRPPCTEWRSKDIACSSVAGLKKDEEVKIFSVIFATEEH